MPQLDSITAWYHSLKDGNRAAAERLWESFARKLILIARARLQPIRHQGADEEDVVLSAFDSFCRAAEEGRFPQLHDRNGLWQLLLTITLRKIGDQVVHGQRLKRGAGRELREADLVGSHEQLELLLCQEPSPQLAAEFTEQCDRLLKMLDDDELRTIALLRMENYTDQEIATKLGCTRSTVQRRLRLIRATWENARII